MNNFNKVLTMFVGAGLLLGFQTAIGEPWYENLEVIDGPFYRIAENSQGKVFLRETVKIVEDYQGRDSITVTYALGHWTLNLQTWAERNLISYTEYYNAIQWLIAQD